MATLLKFIIFHFWCICNSVAKNESITSVVCLLIWNNSRTADQIVMKSNTGTLY